MNLTKEGIFLLKTLLLLSTLFFIIHVIK